MKVATRYMIPILLWSVVVIHPSHPRGRSRRPRIATSGRGTAGSPPRAAYSGVAIFASPPPY
jgi:hypothetical protein